MNYSKNMENKVFWVDASVIIYFEDEIEAENEEQAKEKYTRMVKDNYNLDTVGEMHFKYVINIDSGEFDEE